MLSGSKGPVVEPSKLTVEPLQDGYDFVNPIYSRHKYDGTITNHVCYPLLNGVLCTNLRQPIGGEAGQKPRARESGSHPLAAGAAGKAPAKPRPIAKSRSSSKPKTRAKSKSRGKGGRR